ncbi:MAG: hypothetical protein U5K79_09550 [Cyclobacteriaceae bacterium]|nr:hypothetical protein [Cyclobacteriaceae bacterium]
MDNLENYLYLVFAVIYIISRILKAKPKNASPARRPNQQPAKPVFESEEDAIPVPRKTMSFEDILKEFEKNISGIPEEKPQPVRESGRQITFREKEEAEVEEYETYEGADYENATYNRPAHEYEKYQTIAYEDSNFQHETSYDLDLDKRIEFIRNEKYAIQQDNRSELIKMLREPGGARNAIVLGEIINRKYF